VAPAPASRQTVSPKPVVDYPVRTDQEEPPRQIRKPESALALTQPLSLQLAQRSYEQKDYEKAYTAYDQLRKSLPNSTEHDVLGDLLLLKMALCVKEIGDPDRANSLLTTVLQSRSLVLRVLANYHRSLLEMQRKQYLEARTRAFQSIALIRGVTVDSGWASSLERDCHFLAAQAITRNVLSLCDSDKDLPSNLWAGLLQTDPFADLDEMQLRSLLISGSELLSMGLLAPQIRKFEPTGPSPGPQSEYAASGLTARWSVACQGAPIEELLARFVANAGLDIRWSYSNRPARPDAENAVQIPLPDFAHPGHLRKRPVSIYMAGATAQNFLTVAAGHVGLLARLDDKGSVNIGDPADYSSLSEHIALLSEEAISLWQRFLLTFPGDERIPNVHFAMGLLQAETGQVVDAMAQYKLVANRFSRSSLAAYALLHSGKLKTNLYDYSGAREDLKQLIEQYPDSELCGRASLHLADVTMKAGLKAEAGHLYGKVYNLSFSSDSRKAAALGAGKCFYEQNDYGTAVEWLTRYISLAKDRTNKDLYSACFLLGKANMALGKTKEACNAFQLALAGQRAGQEYTATISALVKALLQQEDFVRALDMLENIRSWQLSQKELTEILLLKASVLRAMGLVNNAIGTLGDRAQYLADPQSKARVFFELADCYIAKGNLELARKNLAETLVFVEPGPLAQEIALRLANVCLRLGQDSQTISVCSQLLDSNPPAETKQKALDLLATAYNRRKDYDKAVLALLGQWAAKVKDEKRTPESSARTSQ